MKFTFTFLFFCFGILAYAQDGDSNYKSKTVKYNETISIDSVSINPKGFSLQLKNNVIIDSSLYTIDFSKAILKFKNPIETDSIRINYLKYPDFLTKTYQQFDESVIVKNNDNQKKLYSISQPNNKKDYKPFDGLTTSGSISRGVTIGNNQNSVLNSELDLQITGKLNDKVSLRASIQDANIPLQESGYSQRLDEFDQVFVELFSDKWAIRAGDIDLQNTNSYFASFSKRVQGLSLKADLGNEDNKTQVFASGALVRGQFATSQFTAQEGNQGPYKLRGSNGELFVLIVSGSETVFVNGVALKRGETEDYIIDYNAGEVVFNATYPITSEMRITVDYQYSERNYSRLVAFGGGNYTSEKLKLGVSIYSENDSKNNPLQQNLSSDQIAILSEAGDNSSLMVAPSSVEEAYNANRILYRKETIDGNEAFVFSTNEADTLFSVRFTRVADNQGRYIIVNSNAISNIYEYVGPNQGNYEPNVQLIAPTKLQIATLNGEYTPTEKTTITFETATSKNDLNLFSNLEDNDNNGFAGKLKIEQALIKQDSLWNLNAFLDSDYVNSNFRNIEGLYNPEFNRDWNLEQPTSINKITSQLGNQALIQTGIRAFHNKKGNSTYRFEHLNYSDGFSGSRHTASANLFLKGFKIRTNSSFLNAESTQTNSRFLRSYNSIVYHLKNKWLGSKLDFENNKQVDNETNNYTALSQKFNSYEVFTGIGDSTKQFAEIGYKHRINDSLKETILQKVNTANTYYLNSRLIKNERSNLSLYVNYRTLDHTDADLENEKSLNSRLQYNQQFFKKFVQWNTLYETQSGYLAQQDFTYVEVEPGRGAYTWIDYNANGIQELNEFEVAQFQDQGQFVRVLLPNQIFLKTHQNKLSQTITLNPTDWINSENKTKKLWSHFYNQSSYLINRKTKREGNQFQLNPFKKEEDNQLGLQLNFRNVLFFNRGKQKYTTSYTFLNNQSQNKLSIGSIANTLKSHQLNFTHKLKASWLVNLLVSLNNNTSENENFESKNFDINQQQLNPKLSYLLNDNAQFNIFYEYGDEKNTIGNLETLKQQTYGASFSFSNNQKNAISGEFNFISNLFDGLANSPVAYQMLDGLQPGKNYTWSLIAQKKITKYLDLNLNYFGRKTETSNSIHTGSIQLKAYF